MPLVFHLTQLINHRVVHLNSLIAINIVKGLHLVLLLLCVLDSWFGAFSMMVVRCLCLMLRASYVLGRYGLMRMGGGVGGIPARLQGVLSVPELLLDGVAVARVCMDGVQGVCANACRVML